MKAARLKGLWTAAGLALYKSREATDESTALAAVGTPGLKGSCGRVKVLKRGQEAFGEDAACGDHSILEMPELWND